MRLPCFWRIEDDEIEEFHTASGSSRESESESSNEEDNADTLSEINRGSVASLYTRIDDINLISINERNRFWEDATTLDIYRTNRFGKKFLNIFDKDIRISEYNLIGKLLYIDRIQTHLLYNCGFLIFLQCIIPVGLTFIPFILGYILNPLLIMVLMHIIIKKLHYTCLIVAYTLTNLISINISLCDSVANNSNSLVEFLISNSITDKFKSSILIFLFALQIGVNMNILRILSHYYFVKWSLN